MPLIYKICPRELWRDAEALGRFTGAPVDHADGYIHFSTADQAVETAARHFAGADDLVLVSVEADALADGGAGGGGPAARGGRQTCLSARVSGCAAGRRPGVRPFPR
jgi:hypothetical protein